MAKKEDKAPDKTAKAPTQQAKQAAPAKQAKAAPKAVTKAPAAAGKKAAPPANPNAMYELSREEYRVIKDDMRAKLGELQRKIIDAKIPVIILFEGYSASGKGTVMSSLILNLDPRGSETFATRRPTELEERQPWLQRFAVQAPEKGRISIFDRAWYSAANWMTESSAGSASLEKLMPYLGDINTFERQLTDDGVVLIKFFLSISQNEQKKRLAALKSDKNTAWRVTKEDERHLKEYDKRAEFYKNMMAVTNTANAKWYVVNADDKRYARATVMTTVADCLERALKKAEEEKNRPDAQVIAPRISDKFHLLKAPRIEDLDLSQTMTREEYSVKLDALQKELGDLHNVIYRKRIPVIVAYEGNDAAGKGGSIRRVAQALDPRGYVVRPVAGPTSTEKAHNHLWRFWTSLPRTGHVTIFDRTWYGRVLVERVEGFTPNTRVEQGYEEINEFEYMLYEWGAVIVKFWLAISPDEQLTRFEARRDNPAKSWKLTDEDWRNREKWDVYVQAVNDMIHYTNTEFAPWTIVEANSKYFARIKTLQTVVDAIKGGIARHDAAAKPASKKKK